MGIDEKLLEVKEYTGDGYMPLVDYEAWRVAILNYSDSLLPQNIQKFERHDSTDEVFVLLKGRCVLFIGDGKDEVTDIFAEDLKPFKVYNVKKSVWHSHTLSKDAVVLVVENVDATYENSPRCGLSEEQRKRVVELSVGL